MQEVLHVHVPHYTHMFKQLLARPRPWRFGHLYLPGGSINLGGPEYELAPGSRAPLTGTLMEILSYLWMEDGRLLVLAVGICRIRVSHKLSVTIHVLGLTVPICRVRSVIDLMDL